MQTDESWWKNEVRLTRRAWSGSSGWKRVMAACWAFSLVAGFLSLETVSTAAFVASIVAVFLGAVAFNAYESALEEEATQREPTRVHLQGIFRRNVQ